MVSYPFKLRLPVLSPNDFISIPNICAIVTNTLAIGVPSGAFR